MIPRTTCAVLACVLAFSTGVRADDPAGDPEALGLFRDVARAYKSAGAYRDQGRFEIAARIGDETRTVVWPIAITLVRPNKVVIDAGEVKLVGDGTTMVTTVGPSKKYLVGPAPATLAVANLTEGPLGAMLLGGPVATPARILLALLLDDDPATVILKEVKTIGREDDRAVDGKPHRVLVLERNSGPPIRLVIEPETRLLAAIELAVSPNAFDEKGPSGALSQPAIGWRGGAVSTEPPGDQVFTAEPPKGFAKVEAVQVPPDRRAANAKKAAHPMVGQPAPEFAFVVLDGPEKTRPVNKVDLQGKVVLIDFWATWCGPCLKKMPEVEALMTRYKDAKDVVVIALNMEGRGDEPAALRQKIETTLKEQKADLLSKQPGGQVGMDTKMALAESFGVNAIPTVVLIDQGGKVRSYRVGEGDAETLIAEIEALRAGKPLAGGPEPPQPRD